jgi:hypothetical protein
MRDLTLSQVRLSRNVDSRTAFEDHQRHHWHPFPVLFLLVSFIQKVQAIVLYPDGFWTTGGPVVLVWGWVVVGGGGFLSSSSQWFTWC